MEGGQSNKKETEEFTSEYAKNAEKKILNNLCLLSDFCGEMLEMASDFMKFLIRPILASKTTILGLKTPISGMYINRYQYDTLARPQSANQNLS